MNLTEHLGSYGIVIEKDNHAMPASLTFIEELKDNFNGLIDIVKSGDDYTVYEAVHITYPERVMIVKYGEYSDIDSVCSIIYKHFFS
jgi:hypothetical protein